MDTRGGRKIKGIGQNATTLPAGQGKCVHAEGGVEPLLLHSMQGEASVLGSLSPVSGRGNKCSWTTLRYTKTWYSSITPALEHAEGIQAVTWMKKETMVGEVSFPYSLVDAISLSPHRSGRANQRVDGTKV